MSVNVMNQPAPQASSPSLADTLALLEATTRQKIHEAPDNAALQALKVSVLGKKGSLTTELKTLGSLPPEERKAVGQQVNQIKQSLEAAFDVQRTALENAALEAKLATETQDITLPARMPAPQGSIHPITAVIEEVTAFFADYGFIVETGPDIEDDFHNFEALNFPPSHPARQMHDTFYLQGETGGEPPVLRTHTSPVQIRSMLKHGAPLRCLAPGSTYRCDSDQTHTPMFHQIEGLVIEKNVHMGHLKGMVSAFLESFFGIKDVPIRFRPSYFPFTEPSAEVDIGCKRSKDKIEIGDGSDWLEIMGCGMVHPNVLRNCNLDPQEWQGFAFGMGVERLAMLKYGITDLRDIFASDSRWLSHYGFSAAEIMGATS